MIAIKSRAYATLVLADERFCFEIPQHYDDVTAVSLLRAGLIGYHALLAGGSAEKLGIYGFGAAGHLIAQIAVQQGRQVYAFTRPGDETAQQLARRNDACWTGESPQSLDAAILLALVGALVPQALEAVERGGTIVCAGIHMSDIPSFPYRLLWGERVVRSIANLTRADGVAFMLLAAEIPLSVTTQGYALVETNTALADLQDGSFAGAAVLIC